MTQTVASPQKVRSGLKLLGRPMKVTQAIERPSGEDTGSHPTGIYYRKLVLSASAMTALLGGKQLLLTQSQLLKLLLISFEVFLVECRNVSEMLETKVSYKGHSDHNDEFRRCPLQAQL